MKQLSKTSTTAIQNLFQLHPSECALNYQTPSINARFASKFKINSDHYHFRFFLDNPDLHIGNRVGQAIKLTLNPNSDQQISRFYSLVGDPFEKGYVDCIIKDLDKHAYEQSTDTNPMVPQLLKMKSGTLIGIEDLYTQYIYHGLGKLTYKKNFSADFKTGQFDKIGIIAHNSAITTFSQLIQGVLSSRDPTAIHLLFHNHKREDEELLDEMTRSILSHNMKYNPVLSNAKADYYGFKGQVCQQSILHTLPSPRDNCVIMIQGPRPFKQHCIDLLDKLGYDPERIACL